MVYLSVWRADVLSSSILHRHAGSIILWSRRNFQAPAAAHEAIRSAAACRRCRGQSLAHPCLPRRPQQCQRHYRQCSHCIHRRLYLEGGEGGRFWPCRDAAVGGKESRCGELWSRSGKGGRNRASVGPGAGVGSGAERSRELVCTADGGRQLSRQGHSWGISGRRRGGHGPYQVSDNFRPFGGQVCRRCHCQIG